MTKNKTRAFPQPRKRGHTALQNPLGEAKFPAAAAEEKAAAQEIEKELDEALEQTFPASDPISLESTLVPGGRR